MWPFKHRYSTRLLTLASLLDTVFMEAAHDLNSVDRVEFVARLRSCYNMEQVDEGHPSGNRIYWHDRRLIDFTFSADYGSYFGPSPEWVLFVLGGSSKMKPSFFGLMLVGAGPDAGQPQNVRKTVAAKGGIMAKATSASRVLARLLSSHYGYRYLRD